MQQKLQQFVFLSERLLSEYGEFRVRKSWNELCSVSVQLAPYMVQLSQNFDPKYAILFLLSCGNEGTQKNGCFSMLFRKILSSIPNKDLLSVLASVNRVELNSYLLPFLYEKGDIGSVAAYISAKLGLKVNVDSFEFFLTSREWSQEDLVNLSFLILANERDSLIQKLETSYETNKKEVFAQFLNVIKFSNITEPILPDVQAPQSFQTPVTQKKPAVNLQQNQVNPPQKEIKFKLTGNKPINPNPINVSNPSIQNKKPLETKPQIQTKPSVEKSEPQVQNSESSTDNKQTNLEQPPESENKIISKTKEIFEKVKDTVSNSSISLPGADNPIVVKIKSKLSDMGVDLSSDDNPLKQPPVIIVAVLVIVILLFLIIWLFSSGGDGGTSVVVAPPMEGKIPEYWVDAVTNRKVTPKYIEADVDYRMGELYLSRNLYNEAIKFFSSALKTDPTHNIAKLRWGYTELLQGNYFVAKKLLKEVLASEPKMRNVNLYLARNSFAEKDYNNAKKYYRDEYRNYGQLEVGMEYANFLASIGEHDDAMDFLAVLQEKYPGKMLILNASSVTQQTGKNTKTKG